MKDIKLFEQKKVRSQWDTEKEMWYFSITDVIAVLTDSVDAVAYWRKLKQRLKKEGNETVTNCHGLKMEAPDGKMRLTDVADTRQLLRLIQSVPSPKAEPFKEWLAKVGYERLQEMSDPAQGLDRAFASSADPLNLLLLRPGVQSEMQSQVGVEQYQIIRSLSSIALVALIVLGARVDNSAAILIVSASSWSTGSTSVAKPRW